MARATYDFKGADPISSAEHKFQGGLVEVDSIGSDSGGAPESIHAQAVAAVMITLG